MSRARRPIARPPLDHAGLDWEEEAALRSVATMDRFLFPSPPPKQAEFFETGYGAEIASKPIPLAAVIGGCGPLPRRRLELDDGASMGRAGGVLDEYWRPFSPLRDDPSYRRRFEPPRGGRRRPTSPSANVRLAPSPGQRFDDGMHQRNFSPVLATERRAVERQQQQQLHEAVDDQRLAPAVVGARALGIAPLRPRSATPATRVHERVRAEWANMLRADRAPAGAHAWR